MNDLIVYDHILVVVQRVEHVKFCREMDSDNNAPCFPLAGLVWLSAQIAKMLKYNHSMGLKKPIF